jgi:hypothetical protein
VWNVLQPILGQNICFQDESCHGNKGSKDRITVLVCANMDGSEKMQLLITEVTEAEVIQACGVPATYTDIKSAAWLTCALFMEFEHV